MPPHHASRVVKFETAKYLWTGRIDDPDPDCVRGNQEGKSLDPDGSTDRKQRIGTGCLCRERAHGEVFPGVTAPPRI